MYINISQQFEFCRYITYLLAMLTLFFLVTTEVILEYILGLFGISRNPYWDEVFFASHNRCEAAAMITTWDHPSGNLP